MLATFTSGQSCSSGRFLDLVRTRSFLGKLFCVSHLMFESVFLQSFVRWSICYKRGFTWRNNAFLLLKQRKPDFHSHQTCCILAIIRHSSRTALPRALSHLCPPFIYLKPSSYACIRAAILVSDLIQCHEIFEFFAVEHDC